MTDEDSRQCQKKSSHHQPAAAAGGKGSSILYWSFISWLVPFIVSIPFFDDEGELQLEEYTFKNCMVIVGTSCGLGCLLRVCPKDRPLSYLRALWLSACFIGMNLLLDTLILLPLLKARPAREGTEETFGTYFRKIGTVYLSIIPQTLALSAASHWCDSVARSREN
ncbi:conserved hypothetical protein [Perkinsus marinus ATCC 50983]|uniref:Uncharacterized protein n=1 Tax=Perkinsus marinus (strain ATCC 50983 / TXsc) TaxID=423536 RepID=C5KEF0_PERM5|nr:conserved hypothetical protein [Perkinsus marinus ATCC 50983]EER17088.1 conserved hypothetical protein [Perkinsus marinus ATCC 50983]|eukprot:XP_002785292.1 conserved hypothetical protein [Perkinsus marinus ATCC 50983]